MAKPEYPKNVWEFRQKFSTERACIEYLVLCKWPDGFVCPKCSGKDAVLLSSRNVLQCRGCRRQTSPLAHTVMHRSHLSIQKWFEAAYWIANHTPGMSATQLQRHLGLGCHETAWHLLHRLRKGMVNDGRSKLKGLIEADETIVGGPEKGRKGRGVTKADNKSLVFGAVEVLSYIDKKGAPAHRCGRVRLRLAHTADADSIRRFLTDTVESGSTIGTDGWLGYSKDAMKEFLHEPQPQKTGNHPPAYAPHIHRAFGNLKTWLLGTHHGVDPKHLQSYLDEYVFRFNRRQTPMAAFQTLLGISLQKDPLPLAELTLAVSTR